MASKQSDQWLQNVWQEALNAFGQLPISQEGQEGPEAMAALFAETSRQLSAFFSTLMGPGLKIPPLGLGREAVLKTTAAAEAHQRFVSALAIFVQAFSRPLFTSFQALPGTLKERAGRIETADDLYRTVSEVLSQHYQQFLTSPEGVAQVGELIDAFLTFKQRLDESLAPALRFYGIPGKEEMDDVYSGLHRLKKRQRRLEGALAEQQARIEALEGQIETQKDPPARGQRPDRKKPPGRKRPPAPAAKDRKAHPAIDPAD